tara:strand:- start:1282 stop:1554 length:273 start_codon:yes stop_codon:yes gene_type:complete
MIDNGTLKLNYDSINNTLSIVISQCYKKAVCFKFKEEEVTVNWQHVYPLKDVLEHNTDTNPVDDEVLCHCDPKVDVENELIIHNAYDGRE